MSSFEIMDNKLAKLCGLNTTEMTPHIRITVGRLLGLNIHEGDPLTLENHRARELLIQEIRGFGISEDRIEIISNTSWGSLDLSNYFTECVRRSLGMHAPPPPISPPDQILP